MYYISHLQLLCLKHHQPFAPPSSVPKWKKPLLDRKKAQAPQSAVKPHSFSRDWLAPCELAPIF